MDYTELLFQYFVFVILGRRKIVEHHKILKRLFII